MPIREVGELLTKRTAAVPRGAFRHQPALSARPEVNDAELARCQEIIGYEFTHPKLLRQAMTHSSAASTRAASNERLEFLGDAVLGMVICHEIYDREPGLLEGEMTKIKSSVVSRQTCARIAQAMGMAELLVLGKGVNGSSSLPTSLAAAAFEAVIGAIFIDGGYEPSRRFILQSTAEAIEAATKSQHQRNYKSLLQQHAQRHGSQTPQYELLDEKGPEHAKCFEIAVRLNGRRFPSAWGSSKKHAEQRAALEAVQELHLINDDELAEEPIPDQS